MMGKKNDTLDLRSVEERTQPSSKNQGPLSKRAAGLGLGQPRWNTGFSK